MFTPLLVASLALSAPVPKAPAPELKWKFAKGDTFYVKTEIEAEAAITGNGLGAAQGSTTAAVYTFQATVTGATEKETTVEVEILTCKSGNAAGGAAVKLADDPKVVGKKMTFTLDVAHKVTKAEGTDKLGGAGGGLFGGDFFRSNVEDLFRSVPGKALGKGDTWTGEEEGKMAEGLATKRTDRGSVAGTEDGLTKLEVESDHVWSGNPSGTAFDLKGEKGTRTILFDPKAGRVRKVEEKYSVAGSIAVGGAGGGGAPPNIQATITTKATVTVTDDKPKAEK